MRHFMVSILSSPLSLRRAAAYHLLNGRGYSFPGSRLSVVAVDTTEDDRYKMKMQKARFFMSTLTDPHDTPISYKVSNVEGKERDTNVVVEVISREIIKPSSPTPKTLKYYRLSMFDQLQNPIHVPFMFFYLSTNKDNVKIKEFIQDRSNHLKQSLSETLTRMYPFAGKLASELHIDCNDNGAYYVETRVDDRLDNVLKKPDNKFLKRLLPVTEYGSYATMIQVNFFKCGGVCITVQHSQKLADGRSTMAFMNTWAAIARKVPNQVFPNFVSSLMFPQNPQSPFVPYIPLWYLKISPAYIKHCKFESTRFVFDALALGELKAKASKHEPVCRVVAVLALLLKSLTTATQSKPSVVRVPVDIRQRLSPPLSESSIGNLFSEAHVMFDPKARSHLDIASMASNLKREIRNITGESVEQLKGENGHVKYMEILRNSMKMYSDYKKEYYFTSSLCNSGSTEVDFGWGKPVWCCFGNHLDEDIPLFKNFLMLMDSCSTDGIEVWVRLEKKVMASLKCNDELLSFASVDPSPL